MTIKGLQLSSSSGFGMNGGRGRCFTLFQDYMKCYSQCDLESECKEYKADHLECIWHHKERARMIEKEWEKQNPDKVVKSFLPTFDMSFIVKLHGLGVPEE